MSPRRVVDNDRNLGRYAKFTDTYGAEVKVAQSSNASGSHVWIFVKGGAANAGKDAAAHLSVEQAREVVGALTEWLEDFGGDE